MGTDIELLAIGCRKRNSERSAIMLRHPSGIAGQIGCITLGYADDFIEAAGRPSGTAQQCGQGETRHEILDRAGEPGKCAEENIATRFHVVLRLAGSVKGLPADLADNPKYMEGFGQ